MTIITTNGTNIEHTPVQIKRLTGRIAKAKANHKAVMSYRLNTSRGSDTFTIGDLCEYTGNGLNDKLELANSEVRDILKTMGDNLLLISAVFGGNKKAFGQFIAATPLVNISRQDRTDAMYIASHWKTVVKLGDKVEGFGPSAIRKHVKAELEGTTTKAKAVAKGKQAKAKANSEAVQAFKNEQALAEYVAETITGMGFDLAVFRKALTVAAKSVNVT